MQIALGAVLVVALLWFVMLRPKTEEAVTPPVTPAGQQAPAADGTSLTERPADAQSAVDDANAQNQANADKAAQTGSDTQSGGQSSADTQSSQQAAPKPEATDQVKPATKSTDPSAAIIASAKQGNTQVILFWDPAGSDDRSVLAAVRGVDTRNGTVKVRVVEIKDVGKYTALTAAVKIDIAPTIVILDSKLSAWRLTGFTDTREVNGLVGSIARRS